MDVNPTAVVFLQSLIFLLQPPNPALAGPPTPASRGRLCCRVGLSAPYYSHRWPGHPSTHPHPLLFCGDGGGEPSYSSPRGLPLPRLPRLCVVPFLGLAIVHHRGALSAAWSMWSTTDFHRKSTVVERLTAGSTAAARKCLLITQKIIIPPPDSRDQLDGPQYFAKKTFPP